MNALKKTNRRTNKKIIELLIAKKSEVTKEKVNKQEVANSLKIHPAEFSRLIGGQKEPRVDQIAGISSYFYDEIFLIQTKWGKPKSSDYTFWSEGVREKVADWIFPDDGSLPTDLPEPQQARGRYKKTVFGGVAILALLFLGGWLFRLDQNELAKPSQFMKIGISRQMVSQGNYLDCVADQQCSPVEKTIAVLPANNHAPLFGKSWNDAMDYIRWKNKTRKEMLYRLCTIAEIQFLYQQNALLGKNGTDKEWVSDKKNLEKNLPPHPELLKCADQYPRVPLHGIRIAMNPREAVCFPYSSYLPEVEDQIGFRLCSFF